jgi:hypothetical protein
VNYPLNSYLILLKELPNHLGSKSSLLKDGFLLAMNQEIQLTTNIAPATEEFGITVGDIPDDENEAKEKLKYVENIVRAALRYQLVVC